MAKTVLSMGNNKRYVSFRLYTRTSEPEIKKGDETGIDVQPNEMAMGSFGVILQSKRQQYQDSRFAMVRCGSRDYIYILSQLAGVSILAAGVAAASDHARGYGTAGLILLIGSAYALKDVALDFYYKYRV